MDADANCNGTGWQIDFDKTRITYSEDEQKFKAECTFRRPYTGADGLRDIDESETIDWMAGYNIYHSETSDFRYVYGYSYESDLRNAEVRIKANATSLIAQAALGLSVLVALLAF